MVSEGTTCSCFVFDVKFKVIFAVLVFIKSGLNVAPEKPHCKKSFINRLNV